MSRQHFINTFLDVPIIRNDRDKFYTQLLGYRANELPLKCIDNRWLHTLRKYLVISCSREIECVNPGDYPNIEKLLPETLGGKDIEDSCTLTESMCQQADRGLKDWGLPHGVGTCGRGVRYNALKYANLYSYHLAFRTLIDKVASDRAHGRGGLVTVKLETCSFWSDGITVLLVPSNSRTNYLMAYTQALMFKDMYHARFNTLVAASEVYQSDDIGEHIIQIYNWFFECLTRYQNRGYEVGKEVEALAKSFLAHRTDPLIGRAISHPRMLEVVREKERTLGSTDDFMADKLHRILEQVPTLAGCVEMFGLQKLSGHPLVDPSIGGDSVRDEARSQRQVEYVNIRRLRNNFCRLYTEGYTKKRREWPPLIFSDEGKKGILFQLYSLNETNFDHDSYDLMEWEHIQFGQHHTFNYFPNFLDLMDDRSISYHRSEVSSTWRKGGKPVSHKRLLLQLLNEPEISIKRIVDRVRTGDIPFDWMIVSLYPKEREFKTAARMFGMMVFEMRAYFAATEANLAENVFPYMPQQTMTLSKIEIQELFHTTTAAPTRETWVRVFQENDVSRWNLHWVPEVVDPIGHDLDAMHGLPGTFTVIHHFFEDCAMVVRTVECVPDNLDIVEGGGPILPEHESSLMWGNHRVGIEGLFQKGWTLCTYPMIDLGVRDLGFKYYLIGQGDNQILMMYVSIEDVADKAEYLQDLADTISARIQDECNKVGQSIKPDETVASTTTITYSKEVYIEGVQYFTSCKAFSRVFPHSASDFPSIANSVASIAGQCTMAAESLKNPLHGFALSIFHTSLYLLSLSLTPPVEASMLHSSRRARLSLPMIYALTVLPRSLGGLGAATLTDFIYKGGADPLSKDLAALKLFQISSPLVRRMIRSLAEGDWFEETVDLRSLLDDPYSLPLKRTITPEMAMFQQSSKRIRGVTKNAHLRDIMDNDVDEYERSLSLALLSLTPLNPLIASDIMGWSIVGVKRMIGKMFTATRTIQSLLQSSSEDNPCTTILTTGAANYITAINRMMKLPYLQGRIESIYLTAERLRSYWVKGTDKVLVGVTAYTPFETRVIVSTTPSVVQGTRAALLDVPGPNASFTRGSEEPYLGRSTKEHRSEHGYRIIEDSAPAHAIRRLTDILVQPGIDSTTRALLAAVAQTRGSVDIEATRPYLGRVYGGTISHRYNTRLGVRAAHGLGSSCIATHVLISTNEASPVSGGAEDYPRMIQEDMICAVSICQIHSQSSDMRVYVVIPYEECSMIPLSDDTMYCNPGLIPEPYTLHGNPLIYTDEVLLEVVSGKIPTALSRPLVMKPSSLNLVPFAVRRKIAQSLDATHSALAIADHAIKRIRPVVGLPELKGLSVRGYLGQCAVEVAKVSVTMAFIKAGKSLRWSHLPGIVSISDAIAAGVATICRGPAFQDDPLVQGVCGSTTLSYLPSYLSLSHKLSRVLQEQTLRLLFDPTSAVYTSPEILYSDEPAGATSRVVLRCLHRALFQSMLLQTVPPEVAYRIARQVIPVAIRREHEESGKLSALYRLTHRLLDWSIRENLPILEVQLASIVRAYRVYQCDIPAIECIRMARRLKALHAGLAPSNHPSVLVALPSLALSPLSTLSAEETPFAHPSWERPIDTRGYTLFSMNRLRGRVYGGDSSVGYTYAAVACLFQDRVCVMIGCGQGAGAAVMLQNGASCVLGLDIGRDLASSHNLDYPDYPTCVAPLSSRTRFERLYGGPLSEGDFLHPETQHLIAMATGAGSLVIVDIPIRTKAILRQVLRATGNLWSGAEVLLRWIGLVHQTEEIYGVLTLSMDSCRMYPIHASAGYVECWFHYVSVPSLTIRGGRYKLQGALTSIDPKEYNLSYLGGGPSYLRSLVLGIYSYLEIPSDDFPILQTAQLLDSAIGDYDHRFSYHQWTSTLTSLLCSLILSAPFPFITAKIISTLDVIRVRVGSTVLDISMIGERKRVISRVLIRLM